MYQHTIPNAIKIHAYKIYKQNGTSVSKSIVSNYFMEVTDLGQSHVSCVPIVNLSLVLFFQLHNTFLPTDLCQMIIFITLIRASITVEKYKGKMLSSVI